MTAPIRLLSALIGLSLLTGCGAQGLGVQSRLASSQAMSDAGMRKAFDRIHKAIFTSMDANHDGWLDAYEATSHMTAADFETADTASGWGSAHRLSRTEFVAWATKKFWFIHDTPDAFKNRFRKELSRCFLRLDENRDGLLVKNETSLRDLAKLKLSFEYDKLNIRVPIERISITDFQAADKGGDGKLNQAEFEDLFVEMVVTAFGGTGDAPAPAPATEAPADQAIAL